MKKYIFIIIDKILKWHQYYQHELIRKKYKIPNDFGFNGKDIKIFGEGVIEIGAKSYICNHSLIHLEKGQTVKIGKGCSLSHNVKIYTSSKKPDYDFAIKSSVPVRKGDVNIGDFVWIGANVLINPGITIGDNAVVGANSVVTKDIEPYSIYGGVPAKLIRFKREVEN